MYEMEDMDYEFMKIVTLYELKKYTIYQNTTDFSYSNTKIIELNEEKKQKLTRLRFGGIEKIHSI